MLELICLNRLLHIAHDEINDAHYEKKFNEHLKENTLSTSQSKDAKCSFDNKLKIECSCVNANSSAHLISLKFVNLVIVLSILIANWLKKIQIHLDKNNDLLRWQIHHAYCDAEINALVIKLTWTDRDLLIKQEQASSNLIYMITINMYKTCVATLMKNWYQFERATSRSKQSQSIWQLWNIKWDWLIANETHRKMIQTFKIIHLFKNMNEKSCKWFVTDTFFEWSFIQMMTWVNMLMTDLMMNQHESIWKEKEVHWVNLIYCTYQNLKKMNKIHMKIINLQEKSHQVIKKYIKEL